jgi:hypothetical protein
LAGGAAHPPPTYPHHRMKLACFNGQKRRQVGNPTGSPSTPLSCAAALR